MDRVPEGVRRLRAPDEMDGLAEEGAPESVIKFQKSIALYADRVFKIHMRVTSLNEIMRFNVRRLLLRMDDPKKGLSLVESMDTEHWDTPGSQAPRAQAASNGEARKDGSSQEESLARSTALSTLLRVGATKVYHVNLILWKRWKSSAWCSRETASSAWRPMGSRSWARARSKSLKPRSWIFAPSQRASCPLRFWEKADPPRFRGNPGCYSLGPGTFTSSR
jgi:hypothetical protein